jgi:DNA-binding HxlR family transcriptional regulator
VVAVAAVALAAVALAAVAVAAVAIELSNTTEYADVVRRVSFSDMNCSVAQTLEVVGEWWTLLILRDCFLGVTRFDKFHERLGIARNVLTERLDKLTEHGVLERRPYQDNPVRCDYVLTAKGRDLWPVLVALRQWGDKWMTGRGHAPVVLVHDDCGHRTRGTLTCDKCGEELHLSAVHIEPGPGLVDRSLLPASSS